MNKDNITAFLQYAPVIIVVLAFCFSYKIFVTPSQMQIELNALRLELAQVYATKQQFESQEKQLDNISKKIDKIYDFIIGRK